LYNHPKAESVPTKRNDYLDGTI